MTKEYNNISTREIKRIIKEQTGIENFKDGMLAAHFICRPLSRPFSVWFIRHGVLPNQITLLMILFGMGGSILFLIPNIGCKIAGYAFWVLWFTMDLCDGQVARFTKKFSKYGTEMDYMAHLIDHLFMNLAIWLTFLQMDLINPLWLSGIFILCISFELVIRNIISFKFFHRKLEPVTNNNKANSESSLFKYLLTESALYPTMIICFSWLIVMDFYFHIGFSLWIFIIWLVIKIVLEIREILKTLSIYYK